MTLKKQLYILLFLASIKMFAQKKDRVLFTIDNNPVYTSEFSRVYEKNIDLVTDESQKKVTNYLDLFINYKLKLLQAYEMGLDTIPRYKRELASYKRQITAPFLKDTKITEALVKEAYQRTIKDVNASHILIRLIENAKPADTLKAYTKILALRNKILKGADFTTIAKQESQDPSAKDNGGELGYFNAFRMVYPFETACYNTPKGKVSMPFRTRFGYHIVKVNDVRPSKGEIEVAHIMLKNLSSENLDKINTIYKQLKNGGKFDYFATKFSEDKVSAVKGGRLKKFQSGDMIKKFEDIAYGLKNPGDISKPFKTKYGYHIVKLIKKYKVPAFETVKASLIRRIEKDERSKLIATSLIKKLKKQFTITENTTLLDSIFTTGKVNFIDEDAIVLTINDRKITADTFIKPLKRRREQATRSNFEKFKSSQILNYYKDNLEFSNEKFKAVYQEYKDGLLLFDLLQIKVWEKSNDSTALKAYFDKNKQKYQWKKRVKADVATCKDFETAKSLRKFLTEGLSIEEIASKINSKEIIFNSDTFEISSKKLPANFKAVKGVSEVYKDKDHFIIVYVSKILPAQTKNLSEVKGNVISDFQAALEKEWIAELRSKYIVNIHKKALKKLVRTYKK